MGFKNGKIHGKKKLFRNNCGAVDLIFTSHITFLLKLQLIINMALYIRFIHKQKVTKLGLLKLHLSKSD